MFENIIDHDIPKKILINIINTKKIPNTFLFYGKEGVGKFTISKEFVRLLNNYKEEELYKDTFILDSDKIIGIDEIRKIKEISMFKPERNYNAIIINNAHNLSLEASNSFLKILEEPQKNTIFILITNHPERIPETVLSRCFKIHFSPIRRDLIISYLNRIIDDKDRVDLISRLCDGSLKDALYLIEEENFIIRKKKILNFLSFLRKEKPYIEFLKNFLNEENIIETVTLYEKVISDLIILKISTDESLIINVDFLNDLYEVQTLFSIEDLIRIGELFFDFEKKREYNYNLALIVRKLLIGILELSGGLYV